jgi:hypothetical protein
MRKNENGQSLIELTIAAAILTFVAMASCNVLGRTSRGVSLAAATAELRSIFQYVRTMAIAHDRNLGVKFELVNERWTWAVYEDGDGDGVRNDDIQRGKDRQVQRPKRFEHRPSIARPEAAGSIARAFRDVDDLLVLARRRSDERLRRDHRRHECRDRAGRRRRGAHRRVALERERMERGRVRKKERLAPLLFSMLRGTLASCCGSRRAARSRSCRRCSDTRRRGG